jgi:hypothetical protein
MARDERTKLLSLLDSARDVAAIHRYLQQADWLVTQAFSPAWNKVLCECNFSIAGRFPCDFLVIAADSCAWHAVFIFLGPAKKSPFTADGTDSKCFATLRRRAADCADCVKSYDVPLREAMSAIVQNRKPTWSAQNLNLRYGGTAADEILDPNARIEVHAKIVMGREAMLSPEDCKRRSGRRYVLDNHDILATYDRFVKVADNSDDATVEQKQRNAIWWHDVSEQPPPGYVGDVCGNKKMLSLCLGAKKPNDRTIEQQVRSGAIWVRKYNRTSYAVWFRNQRDYDRANGVQLSLETPTRQTAFK